MYNKVNPQLGWIEFFEENSFKHSDTPVFDGKDWYIQGQFSITDTITQAYNRTKPFYKRHIGNKDGDLGHVFPFIICSSGYAEKHLKQLQADDYKPIIMESFDVTRATEIIREKIRQAGNQITIDELWEHLSTFSDTEYDT
jgi:hypothetical protein